MHATKKNCLAEHRLLSFYQYVTSIENIGHEQTVETQMKLHRRLHFCQQTILMKHHALFVNFEKAAKFEIVVCCKL